MPVPDEILRQLPTVYSPQMQKLAEELVKEAGIEQLFLRAPAFISKTVAGGGKFLWNAGKSLASSTLSVVPWLAAGWFFGGGASPEVPRKSILTPIGLGLLGSTLGGIGGAALGYYQKDKDKDKEKITPYVLTGAALGGALGAGTGLLI